jgi:hypothetical protein
VAKCCLVDPVGRGGPGRAVPALRERAGCGTTTVFAPGDLSAALDDAMAVKRPWLIEVITDPEAHPPISLIVDGTFDHQQSPEMALETELSKSRHLGTAPGSDDEGRIWRRRPFHTQPGIVTDRQRRKSL